MFAFLLAGDNVGLALMELKGALRAEVGEVEIEVHDRVAVVEGLTDEEAKRIIRRLARTHAVYRVGEGKTSLEIGGERRPAQLLAEREKLSDRKPHKRPEFMPDSTEPFLARALINMAEARRGERLLDPMCNVGGILIEAGLIGCVPVGVEVREELVERAERNLRYYGIEEYELHAGRAEEVNEILDEPVQAAAVDPPYGRSSYIEGGPVERLLLNTLDALSEVVEGKVSLTAPVDAWEEVKGSVKRVEGEVRDRVHGSLTRVVAVVVP
ncbi:TRM11 family SAM-dependent methyltransferase [Methanopyrus sp.]